ncbi:MAG: methylenetetrahydrofolate reductase [Desulfosalsimonadaceae bacterium]
MQLQRKLEAGEFALLAEIEPPKGVDISPMLKNAAKIKEDVTAFVIPEMSNAVMRMSALGAAVLLANKRMETVMQVCCRDRNRIALQADLLAARACGIENIMAVAGEDPSYGDHHQAAAVYDISLEQLLQAIEGLQGGKDMAGIELAGKPDFFVGTTANAGLQGEALEREIDGLKRKIDAGVRFVITPPLFDTASITAFTEKIKDRGVFVIPTVVLLKSVGMARYMARNMPHVHIPDELIKRIQKAPDKARECTLIASETVQALKNNKFAGALIASIGWEEKLPDVIHGVK